METLGNSPTPPGSGRRELRGFGRQPHRDAARAESLAEVLLAAGDGAAATPGSGSKIPRRLIELP
jgi:hypothetical protein